MPSDLAIWAGVVIAGIGSVTGGYIFVTSLVNEAKRDADAKIGAALTSMNTRISECFSATEGVRKEADERTSDARQELMELLTQDREDRRRDMDRIERAIEGFSVVAQSVAGMGRSVEHLTAQMTEHRQTSERQMAAVQDGLRRVGEGLAELRSWSPRA